MSEDTLDVCLALSECYDSRVAETVLPATIDKSTWGAGPWTEEPDRAEWKHAGLPCLALRNRHGSWCGYVAVPPGHPLHGTDYDAVDVDVHGGLTYAAKCDGHICHVPQPGEPDDVWWLGFDCGHAGDFIPGIAASLREIGFKEPYDHVAAVGASSFFVDAYRTLDYVRTETNRLAEQLVQRE